jgi:hypothetical protein
MGRVGACGDYAAKESLFALHSRRPSIGNTGRAARNFDRDLDRVATLCVSVGDGVDDGAINSGSFAH